MSANYARSYLNAIDCRSHYPTLPMIIRLRRESLHARIRHSAQRAIWARSRPCCAVCECSVWADCVDQAKDSRSSAYLPHMARATSPGPPPAPASRPGCLFDFGCVQCETEGADQASEGDPLTLGEGGEVARQASASSGRRGRAP